MSEEISNSRAANFGRWVESQARILRKKGKADGFERLDPLSLAQEMEIPVVCLSLFLASNEAVITPVLELHNKCWDAATMEWRENGQRLIILNPKRIDPLRRNASIMEELAHVHLKHKPTSFLEVEGVVIRTCKKSNEKQAYSVGAAALLPEFILKGARTRGYSRQDVSDRHHISLDLVCYREQVTGVRLAA